MHLSGADALEKAKTLYRFSRGILTGVTRGREDIESAMEACQEALALFEAEADPILWLNLQCTSYFVATCVSQRFRTDGLIPVLQAVLQLLPYDPDYQHVGFANWLLAKCWIERTDCARTETWARAVHHYTNAIRVFDRFGYSAHWAESQNALADLLSNPPNRQHTHQLQALRMYVEVIERASATQNYDGWTTAQLRAGEMLIAIGRGTDMKCISPGLRALGLAQSVYRRHGNGEAWAQIEIERAKELASRRVGDLDKLANEARLILKRLIRSTLPRKTFAWCEANRVLSTLYMRRFKGRLASRSRCALVCLSRIVDSAVHNAAIALKRDLAGCLQNVGRYSDALAVVHGVIAEFDRLQDESIDAEDRQQLYASAYRLGCIGASALIEMGRIDDALVVWESLNMREYRDACVRRVSSDAYRVNCEILARNETLAKWRVADTDGTSAEILKEIADLRQQLKRICCRHRSEIDVKNEDIKALIPTGGALIVPVLSISSSRLVVLSNPEAGFHRSDILNLGFSDELLDRYAQEWKQAARAMSFGSGVDASHECTFSRILDWLWRNIGGPLHDHLRQLGVRKIADNSVPDLSFICAAPFGLLPIHASSVAEQPDDAFMMHYAVSYAPSLTVLKASKHRSAARGPNKSSVFAVIDPATCDDAGHFFPRLANGAECEMQAVRALASEHPASIVLTAGECIKDNFYALYREQTILHMMCHAKFDAENPSRSSIFLDGTDRLSLDEIVNYGIPSSAELVVLASCETAMTDTDDMPEEGMGFAPAFLAAGADSVVAAQWRVRNDIASHFVSSFYQQRAAGKPVPQAVRAASLDAKHYTNLLLREANAEQAGSRAPTVRRFASTGTDTEAASSAFWWAPFAAWGTV